MNHPAVKQMASGRMIDIIMLKAAQVDFDNDVAPALARLCRYDGAMRCMPYSVAQHCVAMANYALDQFGSAELAAACLLHDAHEAYIGDIASPAVRAMDAVCPPGALKPSTAIKRLKAGLDKEIFKAAMVPVPSGDTQTRLSSIDLAMLETERLHLLAPSQTAWRETVGIEPLRLRGSLRPTSVIDAEMSWLAMLDQLCPNRLRAPHHAQTKQRN